MHRVLCPLSLLFHVDIIIELSLSQPFTECNEAFCFAPQICCDVSTPNTNFSGDFTRRDVVMAGALGAAGSQFASSSAPAAAATQGQVTPVNISAKETMQLGKSGMCLMPWTPPHPSDLD